MNIRIREAKMDDGPALTRLSNQLGYPIDLANIEKNIDAIQKEKEGIVLVADSHETVAGWIYVSRKISLESGWIWEIYGMVVDEAYRNKGIGHQLLQAAIAWCRKKGAKSLRVRSNIKRKDAHRFYEEQGFQLKKEQKVFELRFHS